MQNLTDVDTGTFTIQTATGTSYVLDLTARTALRRPRSATPAPGFEDLPSGLRRDEAAVPLRRILMCTVGSPMTLVLDSVDDYDGYQGTLRFATTVTSIERVS